MCGDIGVFHPFPCMDCVLLSEDAAVVWPGSLFLLKVLAKGIFYKRNLSFHIVFNHLSFYGVYIKTNIFGSNVLSL